MLTKKGWVISSGVVAVVLVVPLTMNISVAGAHNLKPLFLINGIVFVLAASALFTTHHDDHHHHDYDPHQAPPHHNHYFLPQNDHHILPHHSPATPSFFDRNNSLHSSGAVQEEKSPEKKDPPPPTPTAKPVPPPVKPVPPPEKPVPPPRPRRTHAPTAPAFDHVPRASSSKERAEETESMEDMWEKIQAEKHMTKSNTWQHSNSHRGEASSSSSSSWSAPSSPYNTKKTTGMFMERIPTWLRMKKEPSLGRDDLNLRVEAFIKKFQDDIRLQRLESLRRYKSKLLKRASKR